MGEATSDRDENADNPIERQAPVDQKHRYEMTWICVMGTRKRPRILWLFRKSRVVASELHLRLSKIFESVFRKSKACGVPQLEFFQR
jgi:hypothetical protein